MGTSINHYIPYPLDLQKAAKATGNGTEIELNAKYGTLVVRVLGITSATITFEAMRTNVIGDAYAAITGTNNATGAFASTATADGTFIFDVRGVWKFRARISTYVSGTIYVHAIATAQDGSGNSPRSVAIDQTTQGTTNGMQLKAGTAIAGKFGIDQTTPGTTNGVVLKDSAGDEKGTLANPLVTSGISVTATDINYAEKEITRRAIDSIIDTIGAENIKLFLPMWETSGAIAYDLLNRDLQFDISGATLDQAGPFGRAMSFDGTNDYLIQKAVTENTTSTATQELQASTAVAVQKMVVVATTPGFVRLRLIKKGSPDGNVKVEIRATKDGTAISNGTSATLACSAVGVTAESRGFTFTTAPNLQKDTAYYIALVYDNNTNADADNNIGWLYDAAGGYGQGRNYYDGSTWTDTAGEDYRFGLWGSHLQVTGDQTLFVVAKDVGAVASTLLVSFRGQTAAALTFYKSSTGRYATEITDDSARAAYAYSYPSQFRVWAVKFDKAATASAIGIYANGASVGTTTGGNDQARILQAQPLTIGAQVTANGALSSYWNGLIGPVIYCSTALTDANIAKVSHYLLAMRKLREVL